MSTSLTAQRSTSTAVEPVNRTGADWKIFEGEGPIIATAIHDGHGIRESLRPYLSISDAGRRREEDPLTAVLASVGDTAVRMRTSRFEFDVNRPRDKAISTDPADTWGLRIWKSDLPESEIRHSLDRYMSFYRTMAELLDRKLEEAGSLLVLDIHSYNHRRDGKDLPAAAQAANPDIDLGETTLDAERWGGVVRNFREALARSVVGGRHPDVRSNVRYPGGGHFPEWVHSRYGKDACTISLEYKKIYMDEWTGQADVAIIDDFRSSLEDAVAAVRDRFSQCR